MSSRLLGIAGCGVRSCRLRLRSLLQAKRLGERPASDMMRGLADPDCFARIDCNSERMSRKLGLQKFGVEVRVADDMNAHCRGWACS